MLKLKKQLHPNSLSVPFLVRITAKGYWFTISITEKNVDNFIDILKDTGLLNFFLQCLGSFKSKIYLNSLSYLKFTYKISRLVDRIKNSMIKIDEEKSFPPEFNCLDTKIQINNGVVDKKC